MSSDDEDQSDASSEANDLETTGLIATRAKRSTAGNLYASLRANLDDEELQKELLAEDEEEDAADYEGSVKGDDDDDEALESSGDEDDAGPPQEGQVEDLAGEKELKKTERKEQRQKRKAIDARLRLPAWQQKKKVKLADDVKAGNGVAMERPKKKSERSNWLPTADDAPTRQSRRSLAVANREVTHANLKQSYERSEKQRRVMKVAAEREKTKKRANLTHEERMKICEKIERQTAKEFGRWEREEAERQRAREELLAAKRQRGLEGPVVRMWSGSAVWAGPRMVEGRCKHGSTDVDARAEPKVTGLGALEADGAVSLNAVADGSSGTTSKAPTPSPAEGGTTMAPASQPTPNSTHVAEPSIAYMPKSGPAPISHTTPVTETNVPWLQGIHDYAMQVTPNLPASNDNAPAQVSAIVSEHTQDNTTVHLASNPQRTPLRPSSVSQVPEQQLHVPGGQPPSRNQQQPGYNGWPPSGAPLHPHLPQATTVSLLPIPSPQAPILREQAQRSLVILDHFPELENSGTSKRSTKTASTALEPNAPASILLPESYPSFTSEESKYLLAKFKRSRGENIMAPAPPKQLCAITSWAAKYRDPKTGLFYADMHIYKIIQRVLAGGYQWSALLGCWVGPAYGPMGRPARGVPEGFIRLPVAIDPGKQVSVKSENAV